MNLFKKDTRTTFQIIEEIHHEFLTAGDELIKEANLILEANKPKSNTGYMLNTLGFINTKEAKEFKKFEEISKEKTKTLEKVFYYQKKYPNNKFITENQIKRICKKYNLICAPTENYKGSVPKEKLHQIFEFKFDSEDEAQKYIKITKFSYPDSDESLIKEAKKKYPKLIVPVNDQDNIRPYFNFARFEKYEKILSPNFLICAPKKDFDLKGLKQFGNLLTSFITVTVPDPVVLKPVKDGYLIIAAWGDEASDNDVVNHKMN